MVLGVHKGVYGVSGMHWGAGRECRCSGASMDIGGIRRHWGLLGGTRGHWGHWGVGVSGVDWGLAGSVGAQGQQGYRQHQGALGSPRGCQGVLCHLWAIRGCKGSQECIGVAGGLGAQPHWAPVQGPSTPTGSPWGVSYLTKARQGPLLRVPSLPLVSFGE